MPSPDSTPSGDAVRKRGRPRRDAEMVPLILDAAERLIAGRGVISVSVRDIADEAGVPHSAIYRYFENKEDVLRQVLKRGRDRQIAHDEERRQAGRAAKGVVDWIMTANRCYYMAVARAAMEGQTASALGLNPEDSPARRSVKALQCDEPEAGGRHDARVVVAAATALTVGWVVAEEWILEIAGLADRDRRAVREAIDAVLGDMIGLVGTGDERQRGRQ